MRELSKSKTRNEENMGQPLVTVSMLVSNRKDSIRKSMESIKPLLDAVPSELIAVDTVGEEDSDGSLEIVREYTDKIIHFSWCNDFAAARNAGLKAATGKWFLFLDDDEWFENITPIILFFLEGDYKKYDRGWYYVRNYLNSAGTEYVDTIADRMCPITAETHFVGRIHEHLEPLPSNPKQFLCYVHHYGYVYKDQEERDKHSARNVKLIELELQEHPDDPRMAGQLVEEYISETKYEDALVLCQDLIQREETDLMNPFVQFLIAIRLFLSNAAGTEGKTIDLFYEVEKKYDLKEVPRLVCLVEGIKAWAKNKCYSEVKRRVEDYFLLREEIIEKGSETAYQQVLCFKKYVDEEQAREIIAYGLTAVLQLQEYDMAKDLLGEFHGPMKNVNLSVVWLTLSVFMEKVGKRICFILMQSKF